MKLFLKACLFLLCGCAFAQTFPQPGRPIRVLVGFAAGGGTDIQARQLLPKLAEALGAPVIVENKPGAGTTIAAAEVARAAPDGHTLIYTFNGTFAQFPFLMKDLSYDALRDFTPISLGARGSQVLLVHETVPVRTVQELIAWGRANPGKLSIGSFGTGTSSHIFAEMLMRQARVDMVHVPYKGSADAAKDLLAGRVQLMFDPATTGLQHAAGGRVRILGIVAPQRSRLVPGVPTLTEQGLSGIDLVGWLGWYGPAKMPREVLAKLNAALVKALADPEVRAAYEKGGYEAVSSTPEELGAITRESHAQWGKLIAEIGIKPQ
jgi:tripartite-type tricarboxylate transporter receptor subunit TctC